MGEFHVLLSVLAYNKLPVFKPIKLFYKCNLLQAEYNQTFTSGGGMAWGVSEIRHLMEAF